MLYKFKTITPCNADNENNVTRKQGYFNYPGVLMDSLN